MIANHEAEAAILGAMLMSPTAIETVIDVGVVDSDFAKPSHSLIFGAIRKCFEDGAVDEQIVADYLRKRPSRDGTELDVAGGYSFVCRLVEAVPAIANAEAYAVEVRDVAARRALSQAGSSISELAAKATEDSSLELAAKAAQILNDAERGKGSGEFRDLAEIAVECWNEAWSNPGDDPFGVSTGFANIDERWGGLKPSKLYILGGRPGMGKSALGLNIVAHSARWSKTNWAIFSLEMDSDEIAARAVSMLGSIDSKKLMHGKPAGSEYERVLSGLKALDEAKGRLHVSDDGGPSVGVILQKCRRLDRALRRRGESLGGVFVDYLQLVRPELSVKGQNRESEVSQISRDLKRCSRILRVPVLVPAQLSRALESRPDKRPTLPDLRESGSIEQDADVVAFLYRDDYYREVPMIQRGVAQVITAKNRSGESGTDFLAWEPEFTRFSSINRGGVAA